MAVKTQEEIQGYEYDWLACDGVGNIGFFSTAGAGYAPKQFLSSVEEYDYAIEKLLTLDAITIAETFPQLDDDLTNTWKLMSERGAFGYDAEYSQDNLYNLVSTPGDAVSINELPPEISDIIRRFKFDKIIFGEAKIISRINIANSE